MRPLIRIKPMWNATASQYSSPRRASISARSLAAGEERGKVELGELTRDLPDAKISDLPVFHRARL